MTDIGPHLERLGLEQYHDAFLGEGFDTWETLLDIQESDFDALNVKLGHRRKLQRAIAEFRGIPYERLVTSPAHEAAVESSKGSEGTQASTSGGSASSVPTVETKRKYRRHPKPDENAPERPPSAYVIFSNKIREEVRGEKLSFTQIAKLVGDRWQKLDQAGKEPYESEANAAKERYTVQLSTYKKTDAYKEYTQYLSDFKAKHGVGGGSSEQKRPKLDPESSGGSLSAKSMDLTQEMQPQVPVHRRGGSMGSVSSSTGAAAMPSPATVHGSSLSLQMGSAPLTLPGRHPVSISRSGTPPSGYPGQDQRSLVPISSQSSMSDEPTALRSEQPDPLWKTASLSLGTPGTGTPPLPPMQPPSLRTELSGSPELQAHVRNMSFPHTVSSLGHLGYVNNPSVSASAFVPTLPSPAPTESSWRSRGSEYRLFPESARNLQMAMSSYGPGGQVTSALLPSIVSSEWPSDLGPNQAGRTLPPPRTSPTATARPSIQPHGHGPDTTWTGSQGQSRRGHAEEVQSPLQRSESDAASTLARLASGGARNAKSESERRRH